MPLSKVTVWRSASGSGADVRPNFSLAAVYFLTTRFMLRAMRLTEPTCRLSFAVISRIGAPSRASRIKAFFSASVHSFGLGFIGSSCGLRHQSLNDEGNTCNEC